MLDLYVADRPLLDVGFDLALGVPADADVSADEAMFLPEFLQTAFDEATIRIDGQTRPLVAETDTVTWVDGYDARDRAFDWPVALGWILFGIGGAGTAWQAATGRIIARRTDAALFFIVGLAGLVICFLWFVAEHTVTNYNWNLLWAWPTHIVAVAALGRTNRFRQAAGVYFAAAAVAAGSLAVGWVWMPQDLNAAVLPLVLLLTMRLAWRAIRLLGVSPLPRSQRSAEPAAPAS